MSDPSKTWLDITHPAYAGTVDHWRFCRASYVGGPAYHTDNLIKFRLEDQEDFDDRLKRAARYNFTRQVVDLINGHLFKVPPTRKDDKAPPCVQAFWAKPSRGSDKMESWARDLGKWTSVHGRVGVVVDVPSNGGIAPASDLERQARGIAPYAYVVYPDDILDLAWDQGSLLWVKILERDRSDTDPKTASPTFGQRYRLWERGKWSLWEKRTDAQGKVEAFRLDEGVLPEAMKDVVPVVIVEQEDGDDYTSPGLIDDTAYLDRDVFNLMSELNETIGQQTFGQLVMPSDAFPPDLSPEKLAQYLAVGKRRVMVYYGEAKEAPKYISPDASQGGLILETIEKRIEQIYKSVNLDTEKGGKSGSSSATSGVTMAYKFAKLEAMLASKAMELEEAEREIARLVMLWSGETQDLPEDLVVYPREFDIATLQQDLETALQVEAVLGGSSPTAVGELRKQVVSKALDRLEDDQMQVVIDEIDAHAQMELTTPDPADVVEPDPASQEPPGVTVKPNGLA